MPQTPLRTPNGVATTRLVLESFRLNGALKAAGNTLTAPWKLSGAKWKVLGAVVHSGRPVHVAQLGRQMGLTRQGVQRTVKELEAAGLVERIDNPDHRRALQVRLTPQGRQVFEEIQAEQIRWSNRLAEGLDTESLRTAIDLITTLTERLQEQKPARPTDRSPGSESESEYED